MKEAPDDAKQKAGSVRRDAGKSSPCESAGSVFQSIAATGRFAIPIAGGARADEIRIKKPGAAVRRGEILTEEWPESSAAPLAPADGRIAALGAVKLNLRRTVPAVLFEPSHAPPAVEPSPAVTADAIPNILRWVRDMGLAGGIQHLRERGIWADRWTCPDLLAQLRDCVDQPIDTVICNVLDESPELLLHHQLAMAYPVELVAGVLVLAQMTNAKDIWAVVAAFGNSIAWDLLRRAVVDTKLKLVPLQDHYPQAHPSLLIHEITGRHVRPGKSPVKSGVLICDAAAAVAIGRCFVHNQLMLSVPMALRQRLAEKTHWLDVPVGMPLSAVLSHLHLNEGRGELRAGNALRELRLSGDCVAAGAELSITLMPPQRHLNPDPCIRCAWCVEGCPVRVQPAGLLEASQQDDPYLADQYGLDACIECGICSYVCPSHLPILSGIRKLRA